MMETQVTEGPAIHSHSDRPMKSVLISQAGGLVSPKAPRNRWNTPLALSSQLMSGIGRTRLTTPLVWNRKMKISETAIELVIEGK